MFILRGIIIQTALYWIVAIPVWMGVCALAIVIGNIYETVSNAGDLVALGFFTMTVYFWVFVVAFAIILAVDAYFIGAVDRATSLTRVVINIVIAMLIIASVAYIFDPPAFSIAAIAIGFIAYYVCGQLVYRHLMADVE